MSRNMQEEAAPSMALPHIKELLQMHTYARPSGSVTETVFCEKYIAPLPGAYRDAVGNYIVKVGESRILWSSHTDTVHKTEGRTKLMYASAILSLNDTETEANCLGADCTVGVWLMRQMILRNVPGLYIFHAAEEIGGVGSNHIADKTPELLEGIDFAIALDRRGETSIVTYQFGGRCASEAFATSFAAQFDLGLKADTGGTFTDTANYTRLVPECTNISVGYYNQHTKEEILDVGFAAVLLEQLCKLDESKLVVARDHKSAPFRDTYEDWWSRGTYYPSSTRKSATLPYKSNNGRFVDLTIMREGKDFMEQVTDVAFEYPDILAEIFEDYGIDEDVLKEYISRHNERMGH
jgi:hypothetical protein